MDFLTIMNFVFSILVGSFFGFLLHFFFTRSNNRNSTPISSQLTKTEFGITGANQRMLSKVENISSNNFDKISKGKNDITQSCDKNLIKNDHTTEIIKPIDCDQINCALGNLHGKLATAQLKAKTKQLASEMSEEEKNNETRVKNGQMESILNLMLQNQEKFGMSKEDIKEQMNLYNF